MIQRNAPCAEFPHGREAEKGSLNCGGFVTKSPKVKHGEKRRKMKIQFIKIWRPLG
jgi:hypothetical protein